MVSWEALDDEIKKDKVLQALRTELLTNATQHPGYTLIDDMIFYKGRCVVPHKPVFRQVLLREYHDSASGGHNGELKTYLRLAVDWYWTGMRKEVTTYVQQCTVCQ